MSTVSGSGSSDTNAPEGFPEPEADGRWDAQKLMDFVKTRRMERAEAIAEEWGTYAVLRFPWDTP